MYTGPRDIHQTPALARARCATQNIKSEEVIIDWSANDDVFQENYIERHFKCKKNLLAVIKWQAYLIIKLWKYKPSVVFNMSVLSFLPIFIYSFFVKVKVIYDCRDYLAVSYNWPRWIMVIVQFLDNITALTVSRVVVPDEYGFEYFYLLKHDKLHVVHNTVQDYGLQKQELAGPIRLGYLGYLSLDRNIESIFKYVIDNPSEVELHIACNFIPERLKDIIPTAKNIVFHGRLSHFECHKLLSEMDYCLMMYDAKLDNYRKIQPTKFYDCLALGLPFICSKGMESLEQHIDQSSNLAFDYGSHEINGLKKTGLSQYNLDLWPNFTYKSVVDDYQKFFERIVC
jgi:hypothetical protein